MMEAFVTTQKKDYIWPYPKPITARPVQPPLETKKKGFYMYRPLESVCHCDSHFYAPQESRYKQLAEKQKKLFEELTDVDQQMSELGNEVLDHPCDTADDKMKTIYQTDYIKRGLTLTPYMKLMAAVESPTGVPVKEQVIGLLRGYRDPTRFRFSAIPRERTDTCPPVTFKRTPETIQDWFTARTGRTEYQDTFSKMGLANLKSRQQFLEPLPSSRRRVGDPCL